MGTLVFAGTAPFAVPTLRRLVEAGNLIAGVITQPDRPGGRGQALQTPAVKRAALELQLPIYQPTTLKDDHARDLFDRLQPDVMIVVAYGKILPSWLVHLPHFGVLNLHGSLLPKYRGAAPIQWAVANGETETGASTMRIDEGLDTGPVFLSVSTPIGADESIHELTARLSEIGSELMVRTLKGVLDGTLTGTVQDHSRATYAPILKKEDGHVDWNLPAETIHNRIRAFQPWPGAVTRFRDGLCKILKGRLSLSPGSEARDAGTIVTPARRLEVVCGDGNRLELLEVQLPNRKPWSGSDFVNGMHIAADEKFHAVADNWGR